jgi:hypothetical protein
MINIEGHDNMNFKNSDWVLGDIDISVKNLKYKNGWIRKG